MRRHILFAAAILLWAPVTASADGMTRTAPVMDTYYGPVYSHTIFTGGEVARELVGDLSRSDLGPEPRPLA